MVDVAARLAATAARLGSKPALVDDGATVTYAELDARVDAAAAALQGLGLDPGDRVALAIGNTPDFVVALYGAWRAGLTAVPLNTALTASEIERVVADAGASLAIAADDLAETVRRAGVRRVLVVGGGWADALSGGGSPRPVEQGADPPLALLQYTSGTTGVPRGAMLTHAALLANHDQMAATRQRVEESDLVLCVLPLFHIYALNVALAFPLSRGATVLLHDRFDPAETLDAVVRRRASVLVGAPPMYMGWAALPDLGEYDLASVRVAVSGAAPLPAEVLRRFTEAAGIPIFEGYGLTETAPLLTTVAMTGTALPGSVGRPVPGVELRLLDEAGREAAPGDLGEVVVRGPNLFSGYWRAPEATRERLDGDGWFRTGDVGYLDGQDLYLVDRKSDLVIVSGFNVFPREVEEVLHRHPDVGAAAVIGVPDERTGEAVKAVVVLRPGASATAEDLMAHCRASLARFKAPREIDLVASLPILPSGKVKRRELRGG